MGCTASFQPYTPTAQGQQTVNPAESQQMLNTEAHFQKVPHILSLEHSALSVDCRDLLVQEISPADGSLDSRELVVNQTVANDADPSISFDLENKTQKSVDIISFCVTQRVGLPKTRVQIYSTREQRVGSCFGELDEHCWGLLADRTCVFSTWDGTRSQMIDVPLGEPVRLGPQCRMGFWIQNSAAFTLRAVSLASLSLPATRTGLLHGRADLTEGDIGAANPDLVLYCGPVGDDPSEPLRSRCAIRAPHGLVIGYQDAPAAIPSTSRGSSDSPGLQTSSCPSISATPRPPAKQLATDLSEVPAGYCWTAHSLCLDLQATGRRTVRLLRIRFGGLDWRANVHVQLTGRCLDLSFPGPVATCFILIHHSLFCTADTTRGTCAGAYWDRSLWRTSDPLVSERRSFGRYLGGTARLEAFDWETPVLLAPGASLGLWLQTSDPGDIMTRASVDALAYPPRGLVIEYEEWWLRPHVAPTPEVAPTLFIVRWWLRPHVAPTQSSPSLVAPAPLIAR
ncbi:hypothetical protein PAPYR_10890 [Paratrimastix pyriformis]|uniref:Uncharacterized protein n=1 Tax=Paratrimastix pyriformis TaxID=342808 RepID=A0ABQ8U4Y3_9EUKA|nr:hypothetical protein PAPYR_10890 [Paratrimastix pyriformis]